MGIRTQEDLTRANVLMAWQFARRMSPEDFDELCRVTVEQFRRDCDLTDEPVPLAPESA